jgi:hypothetical protein
MRPSRCSPNKVAARAKTQNHPERTVVISFPCRRLQALVHRTFLGLRFILKFLWHLERQNRKTFF